MTSTQIALSLHEYKYSISALLLFVLVIFIGFYPLLDRFIQSRSNLKGISYLEKLVFAVVAAIVYIALAGIILIFISNDIRRVTALFLIFSPVIFGIWRLRHLRIETIRRSLKTSEVPFVSGWLLFNALILLLVSINVTLPDKLPDGAFVNKDHVSAVRIQTLTGNLPADNAIPYVAAEYLARGISFERNSPILPGQVVSNRPILVSLVVLPFRLAMTNVEPLADLPTYNYVGTEWPDFRVLLRDKAPFALFLGIGIFLNSLLLLGMFLFAANIKNYGSTNKLLLSLLFMTSPYFLFQTIFTWPKSLAGFFAIVAIFTFLKYRKTIFPAVCLGLAFLSHPSALAYLLVAAGLLFFDFSVPFQQRFRRLTHGLLTLGLVLSPWFLWTNFVIGIKSDLVMQNVNANGLGIYNLVWMRIANLANAFFPGHLLAHGNSFTDAYLRSSTNLSGAVGTIFLGYALFLKKKITSSNKVGISFTNPTNLDVQHLRYAFLFFLLSSLMLNLLFSYGTPVLLHGWQPFAGMLLVFCIYFVNKEDNFFSYFCWAQIAVNVTTFLLYLSVYFKEIGKHLL